MNRRSYLVLHGGEECLSDEVMKPTAAPLVVTVVGSGDVLGSGGGGD